MEVTGIDISLGKAVGYNDWLETEVTTVYHALFWNNWENGVRTLRVWKGIKKCYKYISFVFEACVSSLCQHSQLGQVALTCAQVHAYKIFCKNPFKTE